ncbi:MAG: Gfo/Idh/MocA family oxidoreductase, partial [Candidatus Neomarinimicrobiota bacterium]
MAFGWAIISTGFHSENRIAPAIAVTPGAELVAVCSRDQGRAEEFAEKHGAKAAYHSVEDTLRDSRVDAVFVVSPNSLHARHTLQAAQAGKHVLAEKPMATTLEDALAMVRQCRGNGVKLGLGFEIRQHPGLIFARDVIAQGALGRIGLAQGLFGGGVRGQTAPRPRSASQQWWEQPELIGGASPMMGMGVHVVDLLRFLLGQEVTDVAAITDGQTEQQPLEHLVTMSLRFGGGTIGTICVGLLLPDSRNDITLYGTDGRITGRSTLDAVRQGEMEIVSETVNQTEAYPGNPLFSFVEMLQDFRRAVEE